MNAQEYLRALDQARETRAKMFAEAPSSFKARLADDVYISFALPPDAEKAMRECVAENLELREQLSALEQVRT